MKTLAPYCWRQALPQSLAANAISSSRQWRQHRQIRRRQFNRKHPMMYIILIIINIDINQCTDALQKVSIVILNPYAVIMFPRVWSSLFTVNIAAFGTLVSFSIVILQNIHTKITNILNHVIYNELHNTGRVFNSLLNIEYNLTLTLTLTQLSH